MKRALILGVGGQDGSYLAEHLLSLGYEVHGLCRRSSVDNLGRIRPILDRVTLHRGDLADPWSIWEGIRKSDPDEIYNEADQDNVDASFHAPHYSMEVTATSIVRLLEMLRARPRVTKFFQPLSATMFGDAPPPQNEQTPFRPMSPYACAKAAAYYLCQHYRREHGLFVSTGILYNHDSPRRGEGYLLHKICKAAARIAAGKQESLAMGNLSLKVDIGHARDYVRGIHAMMQFPEPGDYVLGTGSPWTIRQLIHEAFAQMEVAAFPVVTDETFSRPGLAPCLTADASKAYQAFGWRPRVPVNDLIGELVAKYRKEAGA